MLLNEEKKAKLKESWIKFPQVKDNCIWCSACVAISPEVFTMNEDTWLSEVLSKDNYENSWVDDSIMACPVDAIYWEN